MKVCFVGKGGSGKTTLASLFIQHAAAKQHSVLAIDSDINQHLAGALGVAPQAAMRPALNDSPLELKKYFQHENKLIEQPDDLIKTTPPGPGSRLVRLSEEGNDFLKQYAVTHGTLHFIRAGEIDERSIGLRCYHHTMGLVDIVINHCIDNRDELIVVDMTAGIDAVNAGAFTRYDLTFVVVEPTVKSIAVFHDFKKYAAQYGVHLAAVGNKVRDQDDKAFLQRMVGSDLIAIIPESKVIRAREQQQESPFGVEEGDVAEGLAFMLGYVLRQKKNWPAFYQQLITFHLKKINSEDPERARRLQRQIPEHVPGFIKNLEQISS